MHVNERITKQATGMFMRSGIKAITMDEISREVGVSKRTIYENFKDKNELLRSCLIYMDEFYNKEKEELARDSKNTIDMLFNIMKFGIIAINTFNPLFFSDLKKYHYKIWNDTYKMSSERNLAQTFTMIKKGINEGLFRNNIDIGIVSILLHEQLRIMSDDQVFPPQNYSTTAVFENIMINFMRGIATRKGLDQIENYQEGLAGS